MSVSITRPLSCEIADCAADSNESAWAIPDHLGGHEGITHLDAGVLDYLISRYHIRRMLDIGCGPGGMVELANTKGVFAVGVDGDPRIPEISSLRPQQLIIHDFTLGAIALEEQFDLAWSVEFLEHVPEQFQENYMKLFRQAKYVFCTAAPPGKAGHHHVNCREEKYWIDAFRTYGFHYDPEVTRTLREITTMKREFVRETGMFFVRDEQGICEHRRAENADELRSILTKR